MVHFVIAAADSGAYFYHILGLTLDNTHYRLTSNTIIARHIKPHIHTHYILVNLFKECYRILMLVTADDTKIVV